MVKDAVACHFDDGEAPKKIRAPLRPSRSDTGLNLPRELSGAELIAARKGLGYKRTRQTGSHVRMTVSLPRKANLTVPLARAIPQELSHRLSKTQRLIST